jgi:heme/copper-type cytochrome/quinol oxidase subunit 2
MRIAFWVTLVVVTLIGLVLIGGLLAAVRRFRTTGASAKPRRLTAGRGVIAKAAAGLGAIVLAVFIFGVVTSAGVKQATAEEGADELEIDAIAQQWLWRFEYPAQADGSFSEGIATVFSYSELVVPVDTLVTLNIDSTDVIHSWWVPALGPQVWAVPGELIETSFIADEEGLYEGRSTVFSGTSYPSMRASVKVVSNDEYEDYIAGLNSNLAAGQKAVQDSVESAEASEDSDATATSDVAPDEATSEGGN